MCRLLLDASCQLGLTSGASNRAFDKCADGTTFGHALWLLGSASSPRRFFGTFEFQWIGSKRQVADWDEVGALLALPARRHTVCATTCLCILVPVMLPPPGMLLCSLCINGKLRTCPGPRVPAVLPVLSMAAVL